MTPDEPLTLGELLAEATADLPGSVLTMSPEGAARRPLTGNDSRQTVV